MRAPRLLHHTNTHKMIHYNIEIRYQEKKKVRMAPYIATAGIHDFVHDALNTNWKSNHPERFWVDYIIEAYSNDHARVSLCKALKCRYIIFHTFVLSALVSISYHYHTHSNYLSHVHIL